MLDLYFARNNFLGLVTEEYFLLFHVSNNLWSVQSFITLRYRSISKSFRVKKKKWKKNYFFSPHNLISWNMFIRKMFFFFEQSSPWERNTFQLFFCSKQLIKKWGMDTDQMGGKGGHGPPKIFKTPLYNSWKLCVYITYAPPQKKSQILF